MTKKSSAAGGGGGFGDNDSCVRAAALVLMTTSPGYVVAGPGFTSPWGNMIHLRPAMIRRLNNVSNYNRSTLSRVQESPSTC